MTLKSTKNNALRIYIITNLIFISAILLCFILNGCKSKPIESTHAIERIIEHHTDSVKVKQVNKAILDSLIIQIGKVKTAKPECDSIAQATLEQVLKQLNSRKKSGDNEAGIYYDEIKKMLVAYQKIGETSSDYTKILAVIKELEKDKEVTKIPVKYIPWWVKYLAYLGVAFIVFLAWRLSKIWL